MSWQRIQLGHWGKLQKSLGCFNVIPGQQEIQVKSRYGPPPAAV